jgi:hypothetical protein
MFGASLVRERGGERGVEPRTQQVLPRRLQHQVSARARAHAYELVVKALGDARRGLCGRKEGGLWGGGEGRERGGERGGVEGLPYQQGGMGGPLTCKRPTNDDTKPICSSFALVYRRGNSSRPRMTTRGSERGSISKGVELTLARYSSKHAH